MLSGRVLFQQDMYTLITEKYLIVKLYLKISFHQTLLHILFFSQCLNSVIWCKQTQNEYTNMEMEVCLLDLGGNLWSTSSFSDGTICFFNGRLTCNEYKAVVKPCCLKSMQWYIGRGTSCGVWITSTTTLISNPSYVSAVPSLTCSPLQYRFGLILFGSLCQYECESLAGFLITFTS